MSFKRGDIWWADLDEPRGSEPGYRRPVVIVQSDDFNNSKIKTVIVAVITANLNLIKAPGNLKLGATKNIGLNKESVINVSQIITLDKSYLVKKTGKLSASQKLELTEGLKLVLGI